MNKPLHGTIRGRTIELDEDPGVAEGQAVLIEVKAVGANATWGEGIRRSAGGWVDYPELDEVMAQIQAQRKLERRP